MQLSQTLSSAKAQIKVSNSPVTNHTHTKKILPQRPPSFCLACFGKQDIYWIGFVSGFGIYRRQSRKRSTSGYWTFRALVEYSFVLLSRSSDRTINIKTSKKIMLNMMSTSWTALSCGFYFLSETDSISVLPIRDYAWTEKQFMQLVSTFADVYLKDVSAPLEPPVIQDHMRGIFKKTR